MHEKCKMAVKAHTHVYKWPNAEGCRHMLANMPLLCNTRGA